MSGPYYYLDDFAEFEDEELEDEELEYEEEPCCQQEGDEHSDRFEYEGSSYEGDPWWSKQKEKDEKFDGVTIAGLPIPMIIDFFTGRWPPG